MSSLQLNNKLFVTKSILDKQVDIQKNPNIPKELKNSDDYTYRHMGNSDIGTEKMLSFLGYDSIDGLMNDVVPESIRLNSSNMFNHNGKTLKGICSETLMLERMR